MWKDAYGWHNHGILKSASISAQTDHSLPSLHKCRIKKWNLPFALALENILSCRAAAQADLRIILFRCASVHIFRLTRICKQNERKKCNWHVVEKTLGHMRTINTRINLCSLVFFLYLLDSYILFCIPWKCRSLQKYMLCTWILWWLMFVILHSPPPPTCPHPPIPTPPPPPSHTHTHPWIWLFVKIHLLESSKLDLQDLYFRSFWDFYRFLAVWHNFLLRAW